MLARLLRYLVETTIQGQGAALKSYSVAVEGLGRSADFDAQVDTYARVQVARLRKALEAYYAAAGADRPFRLQIENGSYEVALQSAGSGGKAAVKASRKHFGRPSRKIAFLAFLALLLGLLVLWKRHSDAAAEQWRTPNFPWIDVAVRGDGKAFPVELVRDARQTMLVSLSRYEGVRVRFRPGEKADYTVHIEMEVVDGQLREEIFVVYTALNRIVWSDIKHYGPDPATWQEAVEANHARLVFRIAHPSGSIHAFERHWNHGVETPYGCWLRFAAQLQESRNFSDRSLKGCVREWRKAAPGHSLAVALEGWVLLDESMQSITEAGRRSKISEAIRLLEANESMNPASTLSHVSLMRAYNYAGDYRAALKAGKEAIATNPANLDVSGMVGTTMALNNDPAGERLVEDAIARHFNPPPWYFVGAFVSAMMREDTVAARNALRRVSTFNHSLPVLEILSAALEARSGNIEKARAHWTRASAANALLRIQPDKFFSRLPIAPAVRARLMAWLKPVLE